MKEIKMKKVIMRLSIIIAIILGFATQNYAINTEDSILSYSEQTKLYRALFPRFKFQYHYKPGDKLKYKVQIKTWVKSYVDAGPRGFHPDTFDLILEEQIRSVTDSKIELSVKVIYKNTKEPLYWGSGIAIYETEGEVLVNLYKNSWIPEIFNLNTKSYKDFVAIRTVLNKVIPHINTPIFFPPFIDTECPPGYLTKNIDGYAWGIETDDTRFRADMNSIIRNFVDFRNLKCAIFDNMIETDLRKGGAGAIFGTVYFDYENGRVIKLDYSSSEKLYHHDNTNKFKKTGYVMMSAEMLE
jgi:hypothetical protein